MRTRRSATADKQYWFNADEGEVSKNVFDYVAQVERAQFDLYNRFVQLEALYDPNANNPATSTSTTETPGLVIENLVASCVDTVHAQIATVDIRPRYQTDNGGWSVQKTAKRLGWYAEGLGKLLDIPKTCKRAFKSMPKKGTGVCKVYINAWDEVKVEAVRVDDLVVDEAECRNGGTPRQMHRRMVNVDRAELCAMFPDKETEIMRAQKGSRWSNMWAGYRPVVDDCLVVIESHKLPVGKKGHKGYRAGRHTICIDGADLLDEEWHKDHFPYVWGVWEEREGGFYGISLTEGIAGIQRALNKRNLQIDRGLDLGAFPTTYVSMADANLAIQTINRLGSVAVYKGAIPTTVQPPAVSPEVYQTRQDLKSAAYENSGVSRMASQAVKPAGIDSGVAMREYRDQTTQRFATQEEAYEDFVLQVYWLALECCKELGEKAPKIPKQRRYGTHRLAWKDVDMLDVRVQMSAASTLSRTEAGRQQSALELAQAGVITTDEYRSLLGHPDIDQMLSMYTQAREAIEEDIEAIEEGYSVTPEPFGDLAMMVRMATAAYLRNRRVSDEDGEDEAPEEVLEALRQYIVVATDMLNPAPANENMQPGVVPMDPSMTGAMPAAPTAPVAALAPQAMDLMAG